MFGFPAVSKADNFRLTRNLLQSVTFQVRYKGVLKEGFPTSELVAAIIPFLPVVKQRQKATATVQSSPEHNTPFVTSEVKQDGLQFGVADNTKIFVVTDEALTLTYAGHIYTYFAEAQNEFNKIIESILPFLNIETYNGVSIRKINAVNCEPDTVNGEAPWLSVLKDVFTPELIGHVTELPVASMMTSSVVNSRFSNNNDYLTLIYGILPKQIEPGVRQAVLDIDLSSEDEFASLETVQDKLLQINNEIFNIFMWSIVGELRDAITS